MVLGWQFYLVSAIVYLLQGDIVLSVFVVAAAFLLPGLPEAETWPIEIYTVQWGIPENDSAE